jgi:phosphate transport system ATP-binding protein
MDGVRSELEAGEAPPRLRTEVADQRPALEALAGAPPTKIHIEHLHFHYGSFLALKDISLEIPEKRVTALIGPSGCGKTTLLRTLNRMYDLVPGTRVQGSIRLGDEEVTTTRKLLELRQRVGMVFQRPIAFPMSIYDNVAFAPRRLGWKSARVAEAVERSLVDAALWDEVKDRLRAPASSLSGGQQQRVSIARCLAVSPEVILMDEPCSALDPIATLKIEDLIARLKTQYTIVIVTHNMQQAARTADFTAFMLMDSEARYGELIEYSRTADIFNRPKDGRTEDYITGRFG